MASQVELHEEATPFFEPATERARETAALAPLLEGARARGVADAFEMIGHGAILLDAQGAILNIGTSAQALFGRELSAVSGHLVGRTAESNLQIQALVEGLLGDGRTQDSIVLGGTSGSCGLRIRGFSFPGGERTPFQLLAAVLLLESADSGA